MKKFSAFFFFLMTSHFAYCQWSNNPAVNNAICTTTSQQGAERVVSDGSGGAIIAWWDYDLTNNNYNIYAQRINSAGIIQWAAGGVAICTDPLHQQNPEMTSDGNGGAIIVWQDNRTGNCEIYAQKINAYGQVQWAADGVSVGNATNCQTFPQLISDGSGGAVVTWKDLRNGTSYRIYTQHINSNGANQWGTGGVAMSTGSNNQGEPQIISDGMGGTIISWQEYVSSQYDIYAQRVNAIGVVLWGPSGSVISAAPNFQQRCQLTTDGNNGAIIIWEDNRTGPGNNTYAQRVNSSGVVQWTMDGVALGVTGITQIDRRIITDSSGGAFITWRSGNDQVFAQHIGSTGNLAWGSSGLIIITKSNTREPQLITDGGTGMIITWYDYRAFDNPDIFAQHLNAAGDFLWAATGVNICNNTFGQTTPRLTANGNGGAIIAWMDSRNSTTNSVDIYASKLNEDGSLGDQPPCEKPAGLKAINITSTAAKTKWNTVTGAVKYNLQYRIQGTTTWTSNKTNGITYTIMGLTNSTTYQYRVQTYCTANGSSKSAFTSIKTFTTATQPLLSNRLSDGQGSLLKIYPNPAKDFIIIEYPGEKENVMISIYDEHGKLVQQETIRNELTVRVDVKLLKQGIYLIRISDGSNIEMKKFVKQ